MSKRSQEVVAHPKDLYKSVKYWIDYRDLIREEFFKRRSKNPFYSLRTFAKGLDLNAMHLSDLLRYRRGLSKERASRVAIRMGLSRAGVEKFRFLVAAQSGRSRSERTLGRMGLKRKWLVAAEF